MYESMHVVVTIKLWKKFNGLPMAPGGVIKRSVKLLNDCENNNSAGREGRKAEVVEILAAVV